MELERILSPTPQPAMTADVAAVVMKSTAVVEKVATVSKGLIGDRDSYSVGDSCN